MADARIYAAGFQIVRQAEDPPIRIHAAGFQIVRKIPDPVSSFRRRPLIVTTN